jgi:nickel-type superoxide dismutase maturation protease
VKIRIFIMLRKSGWKDRLLVRFGRLKPFRVEGSSMRPTLTENEIVLVRLGSAASAGDIVLAQHPYKRSVKILKRVKSVSPDGRFTLAGDDLLQSTDSRTFGSVSVEYILGKAVCRWK